MPCVCVRYIHHFNIIDLGSVNKLTNNPPCKTMTFFKMAIIIRSYSKSAHLSLTVQDGILAAADAAARSVPNF